MPEDIGTNSDAATFEIVGNLIGIFLLSSMYTASQYIIFHDLLMKFACFRNKNRYIRCFMTLLIILLIMQILINWYCPAFTNNLLPFDPRSIYELFVQLFVVQGILWFIEMIFNQCYSYIMKVLIKILVTYLVFYNTCATLKVIFIMLKKLEQLY